MRGREGLGLGDVKLAAAAGAWTGSGDLAHVLLLAAALALAVAIARAVVLRSGLSGSERVAFGCFLAPSIWVVWALRAFAEGL
jgi:leader peptidase (prepilin peptidase)/N-methyltransferase